MKAMEMYLPKVMSEEIRLLLEPLAQDINKRVLLMRSDCSVVNHVKEMFHIITVKFNVSK